MHRRLKWQTRGTQGVQVLEDSASGGLRYPEMTQRARKANITEPLLAYRQLLGHGRQQLSASIHGWLSRGDTNSNITF